MTGEEGSKKGDGKDHGRSRRFFRGKGTSVSCIVYSASEALFSRVWRVGSVLHARVSLLGRTERASVGGLCFFVE